MVRASSRPRQRVARVAEQAPDFSLPDQHGRQQGLATRRGGRNVLLVFFPFAFTGVCAGELKALSDNAARWDELGTDVLAVSCDPTPSQRAFVEEAELKLLLLSDFWPHGEVARAYQAFEPALGAATRATFVIDRSGTVQWTVRNAIADARDISDYLNALTNLAPRPRPV
jgi:mycoredoxin-dependent peroxiredoxin